MLNIKSLNKKIAELGKIQLIRGKGYFYFVGEDVIGETGVKGDTYSVMSYRLNHLTEKQWMSEADWAVDPNREY
jgi:hypothetical protein